VCLCLMWFLELMIVPKQHWHSCLCNGNFCAFGEVEGGLLNTICMHFIGLLSFKGGRMDERAWTKIQTQTLGAINLLVQELLFLILAHPVYKMWIMQESNTLELWKKKLHFEEKKRRVYTMFKIFDTYICWINI